MVWHAVKTNHQSKYSIFNIRLLLRLTSELMKERERDRERERAYCVCVFLQDS